MSQDNEIILYEGMAHPAKVGKIRYYQDGTFTKRLRKPVAVASLKKMTIVIGERPSENQEFGFQTNCCYCVIT